MPLAPAPESTFSTYLKSHIVSQRYTATQKYERATRALSHPPRSRLPDQNNRIPLFPDKLYGLTLLYGLTWASISQIKHEKTKEVI
ncbi:hypothetical protein BJF95_17900 [Rhizobium oryziradicis]|uniref:Uncharacterized protein n=1 Tax=Rhizobium oryziradicis TaxID=1867956 RepID=A0A1Q8ZTJ0_9HYPH|nr:hypothetical protein BJF95_17900 [Rhizobium oryziradicis]